jgi:hypothetical protein
MRHQLSCIALGGLAVAMLVATLATRQLAFLVAACMAGGLLGLSVAGMRAGTPTGAHGAAGAPRVRGSLGCGDARSHRCRGRVG